MRNPNVVAKLVHSREIQTEPDSGAWVPTSVSWVKMSPDRAKPRSLSSWRPYLTVQGVVLVEALALVPVGEPDDRVAVDQPFFEVASLEFVSGEAFLVLTKPIYTRLYAGLVRMNKTKYPNSILPIN